MVPALATAKVTGSCARGDRAGSSIPGDAWPQLGEVVGRVAPREQIEDPVEQRARQLHERRGAPHEGEEIVGADGVHRRDGDDVLGQDVERVARVAGLLDDAGAHLGDRGGAREQIAPVLGEDDPPRDLADRVARAADALQPGGDRRRGLDLDDQIDRAHVDAELERRRRDDGPEISALEPVLDERARLVRDRPVVGQRQLLARDLVQRGGEALGQAAAVDEDHRRAVRTDEGDDVLVQVGPDRAALPLVACGSRASFVALSELAHVDRRDTDLDGQLLQVRRVDDGDGPWDWPRRRRGSPGSPLACAHGEAAE